MTRTVTSIGREAALALYHTPWWETKTAREIAIFQFQTKELCLPFGRFHKAVEEALGRPVWTHEFGLNADGLWRELMGITPAPTFDDIMDLIPAEKRLIIATE